MPASIDQLPEASQSFARELEARNGRLLNIHARMAASPVVIASYAAMTAAVREHGTFDARTREAIALAVGNQDECDYCQAAHTASAKKAGFSDDEIMQIRSGEIDFDPKLAALAEVARNTASAVGYVLPEVRENARANGWSDAELEELFAHVAVNLYTNYFNHYAATELDFPPAPPLS